MSTAISRTTVPTCLCLLLMASRSMPPCRRALRLAICRRCSWSAIETQTGDTPYQCRRHRGADGFNK